MIGIFDSGFGGLTILRELRRVLPDYDYFYLGDNARAPYGGRDAEEIYQFTKQGVEYLFAQACPLVVLACNTASAVALRRLQHELAPATGQRRVLGIIVPTIEQIAGVNWHSSALASITTPMTIGILATEQTVQSGTYEKEIHKRNPAVTVVQQACPNLVPLIERGAATDELEAALKVYVDQLVQKAPRLDAVLLGCTHYELIARVVSNLLPSTVTLYEQPAIVALSLAHYLRHHKDLAQRLTRTHSMVAQSTKAGEDTDTIGSRFYGETLHFAPTVL